MVVYAEMLGEYYNTVVSIQLKAASLLSIYVNDIIVSDLMIIAAQIAKLPKITTLKLYCEYRAYWDPVNLLPDRLCQTE